MFDVGNFRKWLKFFGIINLTLHEGIIDYLLFRLVIVIICHIAIYSGSLPHVQRSLDAFLNSSKPKPEQINFYDVMILWFI